MGSRNNRLRHPDGTVDPERPVLDGGDFDLQRGDTVPTAKRATERGYGSVEMVVGVALMTA